MPTKTTKALQESERTMVRLVDEAIDSVVRVSPNRPLNQVKATMAGAVLAALLGGRREARLVSREALETTVAKYALELPPVVSFVKVDRAAATLAARSFTEQFGVAVADLRSAGFTGHPYREAAKQIAPAAERTAFTENAIAFNHERIETARVIRVPDAIHLMFEWNAELDKSTCGLCESMHGKRWELTESPPESLPAHPRCRCVPELVSV